MNKTTKGAVAAGAAAVLLLGGAGSLAYWTDDATVNGGSVTSGYLTIDPVNVAPNTTPCDADWVYASGTKVNTKVNKFVPGDSVKKKCTFKIGALGDNLQATPTVPTTVTITPTANAYVQGAPLPAPAVGSTPGTFTANVAGAYAVSTGPTGTGTPRTITAADKITEADNGQTLTATITVTFPYGDATTINANPTQNITATLSALTVKLDQDKGDGNPNP